MLAFKCSLSHVPVQLWPIAAQLIHLIVILTKSSAAPVPPTSNSQAVFFYLSEMEPWNCSFTHVNTAAAIQDIFPLRCTGGSNAQ